SLRAHQAHRQPTGSIKHFGGGACLSTKLPRTDPQTRSCPHAVPCIKASMASLSLRSSSSASYSQSSSFSSSAHRKNASTRSLPRRGQVKAAIFASLFASIAGILGLTTQGDGANEEARQLHSSDFEVGVGINGSTPFADEEEGAIVEGMSASTTSSVQQYGPPHSLALRVEGQVLQV
ncbi:hypothetical protein GOP47_0014018, partial [Adiantum capillus-veneris]